MAALAPKPRNRAHFAVRFASSALRIAAVLAIAAGAAGTFGLANLSQIPGTENLALPPIATIIAGVFIVALENLADEPGRN
ncbi:MAG: hypothetical protein E6J19_15255 [Chloroflexi bacterium]|nr:MAG: hypothetical protein E6J19_15255 [Chloroflexota bacterium]